MRIKNIVYFFLFFCLLSSFNLCAQGMWVWEAGDNTTNPTPTYGTQGVANAANKPSALYEAQEWSGNNGIFWHFGGNTTNVLWRFDPTTKLWTWMTGTTTPSFPGSYGTQGVPSALNQPPAIHVGAISWVDLQGNLWMFGGMHSVSFTPLNDLWKYDVVTGVWTWMHGSQGANPAGNYGTQGVSSPTNLPPGRAECDASWVDAAGNFWIYGGQGLIGGTVYLNDLWRFNPGTNQWTWMGGDNTHTQADVYGTLGVSAPTNKPGGRPEYCTWQDPAGNFWFMGGGDDVGGVTKANNDVWKYDPASGNWTWMSGANVNNNSGVYGPTCVFNATNLPRSRVENRSRWQDECGNLWLFGGLPPGSILSYGDFWMYSITKNQWMRIAGTAATNTPGSFGTKGILSATNYPPSRGGAIGFQRNVNGVNEFWLFAGLSRNDMWRYIPDTPTASFTYSTNSNCVPVIATFTNSSTPGCNEIKSYAWDFGDPASGVNNTSTLENPSHTYNTSGTYNIKLVVTNCTGSKDSVSQTYSPSGPVSTTATVGICPGQSALIHGVSQNTSGVYTQTYTTAVGCDSTSSITLNVGNPINTSASLNICNGQSISIHGVNQTTAGIYTQTFIATSGGCDSISTVTLSVTNTINTTDTISICNGQATTIHGTNQSIAGVYTQTYIATTSGCDSISAITLSVVSPITNNSSINICSGQSTLIHGANQNTSGIYTQTFTSAVTGCDSISTVTLTVSSVLTGTINPVSCNSYTVNGQTYSASGIYTQSLSNASGCDSILTINFTLTPAINTSNNLSICSNSSAIIHGINQNTSGVYVQTFTTTAGCDSTSTINLAVVPSPTITVSPLLDTIDKGNSITITASGANTYTWNSGSTTAAVTVSPTQSTTYCVVGTNSVICSDTVCSDIIVITNTCDGVKIFIPTGFSPNNDGQNDELKLFATGKVESLHFAIYNRWGQLVFETTDITKTWDGVFNNQLMDAAVFTYTLRYSCKSDNSESVISGNITLVR